jgi:hypothetical protein
MLKSGPRMEQIAAQRARRRGAPQSSGGCRRPSARSWRRFRHRRAVGNPARWSAPECGRHIANLTTVGRTTSARTRSAGGWAIPPKSGSTYADGVLTVSFISRKRNSPAQRATKEERVKLVYRVKVRVIGDTAVVLKPGLSADVVLGSTP